MNWPIKCRPPLVNTAAMQEQRKEWETCVCALDYKLHFSKLNFIFVQNSECICKMQIVNGQSNARRLTSSLQCSAKTVQGVQKGGRCRREGGRRWRRGSLVPTLVLVQTVHKHLSTSFSSKRFPAPERLSLIFISFHSNGSALFLHSYWPLKCYDIVSTS